MKKSIFKSAFNVACLTGVLVLAGCSGGGGGGGSTGGGGGTSTYGAYSSPNITATGFVNGLNDADNADFLNESEVILFADETYRSAIPGEEDWFVIYDAKFDENKAVSLQYLRSIIYYDYYANNFANAEEFRNIESDDIFNGDLTGDFWGDNYEVVVYDDFTESFWGENSGLEYEDETETTDVALMVGEKEQMAFMKKASNISFAYSVNIETALSLVTLGDKVEQLLDKSKGDLTADDQVALMGDLEKMTGVPLSEMLEATVSNEKKDDVIKKISAKIGTSASNLENRLLPDLFGVSL